MIRAPIETSLSTKKSLLSNIFSKIRIVPCAWVATVTAIEVRSAGNAGQIPLSIFGTWPPRSSSISSRWRHADAGVRDVHLEAKPAERRDDRDEVVRLDVRDLHLAARRGREADERRNFDVIGPDAVLLLVDDPVRDRSWLRLLSGNGRPRDEDESERCDPT
jgi:hypothetical protein